MLSLKTTSSQRWLDQAAANLPELLIDHAHCEKKAAGTAMNLLFAYVENVDLCRAMTEIVQEELSHFHMVLDILAARGIPFKRMEATPYAAGLREMARTRDPERLIDTLLCCALIEARSCERMQILAAGLPDAELAALYESLLASEARHHATYVDLALGLGPREEILGRLDELGRHEAAMLSRGPRGSRLHE